MKKLFLLFGLLSAMILPGRAQDAWAFRNGEEYASYVELLQTRLAESLSAQDNAVGIRRERRASLKSQLDTCTDPQLCRILQSSIDDEFFMIGQVNSRYLQDQREIEEKLKSVQERYQFVFPEAFPYYRDREEYSKEELQGFLKQASGKIRRSEQGKALKQYIKTLP